MTTLETQRMAYMRGYDAGAKNEWISVKERLPINDDLVLGWFVGLFPMPAIVWFSKKEFYPGRDKNEETCTKWITHWMPIPNPPIMDE